MAVNGGAILGHGSGGAVRSLAGFVHQSASPFRTADHEAKGGPLVVLCWHSAQQRHLCVRLCLELSTQSQLARTVIDSSIAGPSKIVC